MNEEKTEKVEILDEYDFSNAVIGKHAKQYAEGTNIVVLEPDVAEVFPDSLLSIKLYDSLFNSAPVNSTRRVDRSSLLVAGG